MSRLFNLKLRTALPTILALGVLLTASVKSVWADPPAGVERTFAVEFIGPQPDFLAPESLCVVVAPADLLASTEGFHFADHNFFDSTIWEHRQAMHVQIGGAEVPGFVTWLVTPDTPAAPPTGATTFTGPDSVLVLDQKVVYIKQCTVSTCGPNSAGKVHIGTPQDNDGKLVVVTAVFSR